MSAVVTTAWWQVRHAILKHASKRRQGGKEGVTRTLLEQEQLQRGWDFSGVRYTLEQREPTNQRKDDAFFG